MICAGKHLAHPNGAREGWDERPTQASSFLLVEIKAQDQLLEHYEVRERAAQDRDELLSCPASSLRDP